MASKRGSGARGGLEIGRSYGSVKVDAAHGDIGGVGHCVILVKASTDLDHAQKRCQHNQTREGELNRDGAGSVVPKTG